MRFYNKPQIFNPQGNYCSLSRAVERVCVVNESKVFYYATIL